MSQPFFAARLKQIKLQTHAFEEALPTCSTVQVCDGQQMKNLQNGGLLKPLSQVESISL